VLFAIDSCRGLGGWSFGVPHPAAGFCDTILKTPGGLKLNALMSVPLPRAGSNVYVLLQRIQVFDVQALIWVCQGTWQTDGA
jgi:hypothetical protein